MSGKVYVKPQDAKDFIYLGEVEFVQINYKQPVGRYVDDIIGTDPQASFLERLT